MKIKEAVNRIFWRFGGNNNTKPFPVNQGDIEAYNAIKDFVAEKEKEQFQNNELFAKMYIFLYGKILENDKTTVFDTTPRRKMYNLLNKPLSQIVSEFTEKLNESEQYELLEAVQGQIKHPAALSEAERIKHTEKLKESIKDPENMRKLLGEVWEYDFVKDCLEAEVNQALEFFKER